MLKSLVKLFGGNKAEKSRKAAEEKRLNDEIEKSINEYKNREAHAVLTADIIDNTPDDELGDLVFDSIAVNLRGGYKKEYKNVVGLPGPKQAVYVTWVLEAEVLNGGFNQYYYNSRAKFINMLVPALELTGAKQYAALVNDANKTFKDAYEQITRYQDGSIEGFSKSYEDNPLNKFDDAFYALEEDGSLSKIIAAFIRNNKADFV